MRSQSGSAAKTATILMLVISGAIAVYLSMQNKESLEPAGGRGADFQPHNDVVRGELQRTPAQKPFSVTSVDEMADMTHVTVNSPASTECDAVLLQQLYLLCTTHRTQMHRDGNCHVVLQFTGGECAQPNP